MLSKTRYAQLAAVAALTVLFGANASTTTAQAQGNQPTQIEKTQEGQTTRSGGQKTRDAGSARETSREGGSVRSSGTNREMRSDRSRDRTSTQTTTRRGTDSNRTRVTTRDRDWNRDHNHDRWRGHGHKRRRLGPVRDRPSGLAQSASRRSPASDLHHHELRRPDRAGAGGAQAAHRASRAAGRRGPDRRRGDGVRHQAARRFESRARRA